MPDDTDAPDAGDQNDDENRSFTQAELDRIVKERVARERTKYANYGELSEKAKRLDDIEEANKTEQQKLTDRLNEAERRALTAEREALRVRIANQKGLTGKWADRLRGETEEELEADADGILADLADTSQAPDLRQGAGRGTAVTTPDNNDWMRQQALRS